MSDTCCQRHGYDDTGRYHVPGPTVVHENRPDDERYSSTEAGDPPSEPSVTGRRFVSGAYRDADAGKPDYAGFLSPLVIQAYGEYMDRHRVQSDGRLRGSDNWKAGIPRDVYLSSAFRHFHDLWMEHEGYESRDGIGEALGGLLFNVMGYWHEHLKEQRG
jgi:hypothetical protein